MSVESRRPSTDTRFDSVIIGRESKLNLEALKGRQFLHVLSLTLEYTSFTLSLTSEHIFFVLSPTPADFPNRFFAFPIPFVNPVLYMKVIL